MKRLSLLAGFAILSSAELSCAAVQDPFPNQPGALSADETQDATKAMQAIAGGESFTLVASGRRDAAHALMGYALFAAPPRDFSSQVRTRRQVACNYVRMMDRWQCTKPHDEFRMTAHGIEHVFSYLVLQGSGDRQAAVDAADFMYSECFRAQYAATGGKPFTPSPDSDYVNTVMDGGKEIRVMTGPLGEGSSYSLEKTDRKTDNCGFRIVSVRIPATGVVPGQSGANQAAPQITEPREKLELTEKAASERAKVMKERDDEMARNAAKDWREFYERTRTLRIGPFSVDRGIASGLALLAGLIFNFLAIGLPWFVMRKTDAWSAAAIAVACAIWGTLLGSIAMNVDSEGFEGFLPIFGLPMLLAWPMAIGFLVRATVRHFTAGR